MIKTHFLVITLLLIFLLGTIEGENEIPEKDFLEHNNKTLKEMPEYMKKVVYEEVSPVALEEIEKGRPPSNKLIEAGLGREKFEGEVYALYHKYGAVYVMAPGAKVILSIVPEYDSPYYGSEKEVSALEIWDRDIVYEYGIGPPNMPPPPPASSTNEPHIIGFFSNPEWHEIWGDITINENETINKTITTKIDQIEYAPENKTEMPENKKTYPDNSIKNYTLILFVLLIIVFMILIVFRRK